jgi:trimeric autotransporter adhesin
MALGQGALAANTGGSSNTAMGFQALNHNTTVSGNTAVGFQALFSNTTGNRNTAIGNSALFNNSGAPANGSRNTAVGITALFNNTDGRSNNAFGDNALVFNTIGSFNEAFGVNALVSNVDGVQNVAIGDDSLLGNNGDDNTALGGITGVNMISGDGNTLLGANTGNNLTTGDFNTYIGVGVGGPVNENGWVRINDNFAPVGGTTSKVAIGGIAGATVGAAFAPVIINGNGQLGTAPSSRRFKKDIDPMGKTSEALFSLRPVTFHYKGDTTNMSCFGLIAEEVAKVNPDLILLDKEGKPLTVRYEQINAMLLNEFLKEHKRVEKQQASIADLKSTVALQQKGMDALVATVKEQAAQIQKVSAQVETIKPAPKVVANQ